jgi:hypothetical protein
MQRRRSINPPQLPGRFFTRTALLPSRTRLALTTGKPVQCATSFALGYHDCDEEIGEKVLGSADHVSVSKNAYDWLGAGAYFWENSPERALSWAKFLKKYPPAASRKIGTPFVIGAIIDLGNCLDLSDAGSLTIIKNGYNQFKVTSESARIPMPVNEPSHDEDSDLVKRHLDCAVMNFVHALRDQT